MNGALFLFAVFVPGVGLEFIFNPIGKRKDGIFTFGRFVELVNNAVKGFVHIPYEIKFFLSRSNEVTQVLIGCEIRVPHQCWNRHLVVNIAEEINIPLRIFFLRTFNIRRCCGQPKHDGIVKEVSELMQHTPPMVEQVMTFVENDEPDTGLFQAKQR